MAKYAPLQRVMFEAKDWQYQCLWGHSSAGRAQRWQR